MSNRHHYFKFICFLAIFLLGLILPLKESLAQRVRCPETNRELYLTKPYLKGDDVWELQMRLKELGFYTSSCDGVYGRKTADAVIKFHEKNLLQPTSLVSEQTWTALGQGCEIPATTTPDTPPRGVVSLVIDLEKRTLTVMDGQKVYLEFPVAVGKQTTPTPVGEWKIIDTAHDWGGAFGVRWLGLNVPWGNYGIHGTNRPWSIGDTVSAGCVRMFNEDVLRVFELAPIGTRVKIAGAPHWTTERWQRPLKMDVCGPDVVYVQLSLKELGHFPYYCDGWYGYLTDLSVRYFQMVYGLTVTGEVDEPTYNLLQKKAGIIPLPEP